MDRFEEAVSAVPSVIPQFLARPMLNYEVDAFKNS